MSPHHAHVSLRHSPLEEMHEIETHMSHASDGMAPDLVEITMRQLNEDVLAYEHDLDYCNSLLTQPDLTPPETRTLQLRTLDLGHHIRQCKHRIELYQFHRRNGNGNGNNTSGSRRVSQADTDTSQLLPRKRKLTQVQIPENLGTRPSATTSPPTPADEAHSDNSDNDTETSPFQRLGYWDCNLCLSAKYLTAGEGRSPVAPCKWPLKDTSKLIGHFMDMHKEHTAAERCEELGRALDCNRGPFRYWLCKTKARNIGDGSVVEECIRELKAGRVPGYLRGLHKGFAGVPS